MTLSVKDKSVLNVLPVGMQNSALVLKDEDDSSIITNLGELVSSSELNLNPSSINIENSTDVIIGPVTQFHGPVTIYQNVNGNTGALGNEESSTIRGVLNGRLIKSESSSSDSAPQASEKSPKTFLYSKHFRYVSVCVFILIIIAVASVIVLSVKSDPDQKKPPPSDNKENVDDDELKPAGPGAIIPKQKWGGQAALSGTIRLKHPISYVIISHTVTPNCSNFNSCSNRVKSIQDYHMGSLGSPDIGYNFIIGGDGNAYVGRGWDIKNFHMPNSIGISFIGNYISDFLTPDMISVTKKLLEEGVKTKKLAQDYKLIAHNQTYATESPGPHVYEVIKKWPHFYSGQLF